MRQQPRRRNELLVLNVAFGRCYQRRFFPQNVPQPVREASSVAASRSRWWGHYFALSARMQFTAVESERTPMKDSAMSPGAQLSGGVGFVPSEFRDGTMRRKCPSWK